MIRVDGAEFLQLLTYAIKKLHLIKITDLITLMNVDDLTPPINYYRNLVYSLTDPKFPRSLISVPTLLIWGEKDDYLNISMASLSSK